MTHSNPSPYRAPSGISIGHVHLKVADLDRAVQFYEKALGFDVMVRAGNRAAFLSADGYHHHLGLNTWESLNGTPAPRGHTGLYHVAYLYPTRADLGRAVAAMIAAGGEYEGASDHGVSKAVYFRDPDGNGIELYRDRARHEWPKAPDGSLAMTTAPLDVEALIKEGRKREAASQS